MSKAGVTKKNDPKYIDLLDEDMPVAGQKFVCLSFISPEKVIQQKEMYFFAKFLKTCIEDRIVTLPSLTVN